MWHPCVTAGLKYVGEGDDIGLHIIMRVGDAVAHSSLGCEVDDAVEAAGGEKVRHHPSVSEIAAYKVPVNLPCIFANTRKPRLLQHRIIIAVQRVYAGDQVAAHQQLTADMRPDETGRAGDKHFLH